MFHKDGKAPIIGTFEKDAANCEACRTGQNCAQHGHQAEQQPQPPDRQGEPKSQ